MNEWINEWINEEVNLYEWIVDGRKVRNWCIMLYSNGVYQSVERQIWKYFQQTTELRSKFIRYLCRRARPELRWPSCWRGHCWWGCECQSTKEDLWWTFSFLTNAPSPKIHFKRKEAKWWRFEFVPFNLWLWMTVTVKVKGLKRDLDFKFLILSYSPWGRRCCGRSSRTNQQTFWMIFKLDKRQWILEKQFF